MHGASQPNNPTFAWLSVLFFIKTRVCHDDPSAAAATTAVTTTTEQQQQQQQQQQNSSSNNSNSSSNSDDELKQHAEITTVTARHFKIFQRCGERLIAISWGCLHTYSTHFFLLNVYINELNILKKHQYDQRHIEYVLPALMKYDNENPSQPICDAFNTRQLLSESFIAAISFR